MPAHRRSALVTTRPTRHSKQRAGYQGCPESSAGGSSDGQLRPTRAWTGCPGRSTQILSPTAAAAHPPGNCWGGCTHTELALPSAKRSQLHGCTAKPAASHSKETNKQKKSQNKEIAKSKRIPQPGRRCLVPHERRPLGAKVQSAACATASPWHLPGGTPKSPHGPSARGRDTGAAPALPYLGLPSSAAAEGASAPAARREAEGGRHRTALPPPAPAPPPGGGRGRRGRPGQPPSGRGRCWESGGRRAGLEARRLLEAGGCPPPKRSPRGV